MAYKEKDIEKLYYSIGEVADMLGVNASLLRYWESEFPELQVRKDRNGVRLFTKQDIETVKSIYHLVKEKGYTIEGAKVQLKNSSTFTDKAKLIDSLKSVKKLLENLRDGL
ncbi:MAG: MerR family transcriptional regulator [Cyclobacteriaceae bacterium]|nr:MAG: MerR family transcriptional regulator [Cyclobacteriaceae bacterium]